MIDAPILTSGAALVLLALAGVVAALTFRRAWLGPASIVATAPFAWYHQMGPTELTVNKAAFVGAAAGVLLGLIADRARLERAIFALKSSPGVMAFIGFAAFSGLSVLWAGSTTDAARDALRWAWYAGTFALTVVAVEDSRDRLKVAVTLFAAAAVVGVYGLWQNATVAPAAFVAGGNVIGRIASTIEGPNQFGAYLETAIPALLAVLLFAKLARVSIVIGGLVLGLLYTDLLLTYSRGALVSCAAATVFVAIAYARRRRGAAVAARTVTVSPLAAIALAALVAAIVIPVAHGSMTLPGWQHELWSAGLNDKTDAVNDRRRLWMCAAVLFERHPLGGVGAGNYADAQGECALAVSNHSNANEWYLETAADLGAIGLALLAAFLGYMFAAARNKDMWMDPVAVGAYGALIAIVLHGFIDDVMPYPKAVLSFMVLLGMIPSRRSANAP
jgi:O-antigen ligase/polysaccharide polymerase Wzy-like membrane protein